VSSYGAARELQRWILEQDDGFRRTRRPDLDVIESMGMRPPLSSAPPRRRWHDSHARSAALVLLAGAVLVAAPPARADGDFVDIAVGHSRVWLVGAPGVRSLDARTGRTLTAPRLVGAAYPLSVTLAGGAVWVASVENGYVWGTLSRIVERTGKVRVVWRRYGSSVQYVAAGARSVWALIGSRRGARIARFTLAGRLLQTWQIPDAGRIAADQGGCWVSTNRWLLRIDPAGRVHRVVRAALGDVATGDGAVWLPQPSSILRIDERTGHVRRIATGPLRLGGFQHDLAVGADALWALQSISRTRSTLVRFDVRTGRATARTSVPGLANAVAFKSGVLWIASVNALIRVDPRTLRRTLLVQIT
jgi:hypothetical protein